MEDQNQPTPNSSNKVFLGIATFVLIAAIAIALNQSKQVSKTKSQSDMTQITPTPTNIQSNVAVKDGSYQATGSYTSPAGPEEIDLQVTVKDGVVTATTATPKTTHAVSIKFQTMFAENYQSQVVGKNITDLKLDKVSGSSLTPKGFNDAVQKIIDQAQG